MSVFITKSGDKYHLYESCVIKYHPRKILKEEAIKKGLQLCKNCHMRLLEKKPNFPNNKKNKNFYKKDNNININKDDADDIIYNDPLMKEQETTEEEYIDIKRNININNKRINLINDVNNLNINESESQTIDFNKNSEINNINNINNDKKNNNIFSEEQSKNSEFILNNEKGDWNIINNKEYENFNMNKMNLKKYNDYNYYENMNMKENNKKKILERIEEDIEKDKKFGNDINKKIEKKQYNNDIIEKIKYNYIEDSKENKEETILNNSINSYKTIYNNNININTSKHKLCNSGDMDILKETDESAVLISFPSNDSIDLKDEPNNKNLYTNLQNGKYKYTFEIKNLKEKKIVELEVGYKITYKCSFDLNFKEKNSIKNNNQKFKIGTLYDKISISKQLLIADDTNVVYAFINIKKGKFVLIGKNELEKRRKNIYLTRENTEIFYIKNCGPIYYFEISNVEPIFNISENSKKSCIIKFNGKKI